MKFIKALLFSSLFLMSMASQAQPEVMHALGGGIVLSSCCGGPNFIYNPRVVVLEIADELTLAAVSYPALGLFFQYNSRVGGELFFSFDLPIMAEIAIGCGSSEYADANIGAYAGAGLGYHFSTDGFNGFVALGPIVDFGIRFYLRELGSGRYYHIREGTYSLHVSYLPSLLAAGGAVLSVGFLTAIGY